MKTIIDEKETKIMAQMRAILETKMSDTCEEIMKIQNEKVNEIERKISEIT